MAEPRPIGRIVRLQVQTASLKVPGPRFRAYDPTGIQVVARLRLDDGGVTGVDTSGQLLPDVHHRDHPASKFRGENGLSVGFTSHYQAMRTHFPVDPGDGAAGENIVVATDRRWSEDELAPGLEIVTAAGPVAVHGVIAAAPCVEFARYMLDWPPLARPNHTVSDAVAYLSGGTRGFYATLTGASADIAVGDLVVVRGGP